VVQQRLDPERIRGKKNWLLNAKNKLIFLLGQEMNLCSLYNLQLVHIYARSMSPGICLALLLRDPKPIDSVCALSFSARLSFSLSNLLY
jgi:hypothetical protein